jgi:hypothetical protein
MAKRRNTKNSTTERDYEVGYGKPPRGKPFPPGTSGNPSGRRKKEESVIEIAQKELARPRRATHRGKAITYKFNEIAGRQLAKKIARGDLAALRLVEGLIAKPARGASSIEPPELLLRDPDAPLTASEQAAFGLASAFFAYTLHRIDGFETWPGREGA